LPALLLVWVLRAWVPRRALPETGQAEPLFDVFQTATRIEPRQEEIVSLKIVAC
jgi:hypothetical protein